MQEFFRDMREYKRMVRHGKNFSEYVKESFGDVKFDHGSVDAELLHGAIYAELLRLYGKDTADDVSKQIKEMAVIETGFHVSFPRTATSYNETTVNKRRYFDQGAFISAAANRVMGHKYHIGLYAGNVALSMGHSNCGHFGLTSNIVFATASNMKNRMATGTGRIEEAYFNEGVLLSTKLIALQKVLEQGHATHRTLTELLAPLNNGCANAHAKVLQSFNCLQSAKKEHLLNALRQHDAAIKDNEGLSLAEMDRQYENYRDILGQAHLADLVDQATMIQNFEYDKVLGTVGMRQITLNIEKVMKKYFIDGLRNEKSTIYKIFSDKEKRDRFVSALAGIRSGWNEGDSPFVGIKDAKGRACKCFRLGYDSFDHDTETLARYFENDEIACSYVLFSALMVDAGFLGHGGVFHTNYGRETQEKYVEFLRQSGETEKAEHLARLHVGFSCMGISARNREDGTPFTLADILAMDDSGKRGFMEGIAGLSMVKAVKNGVRSLVGYLEDIAPGYLSFGSEAFAKWDRRGGYGSVIANKIRERVAYVRG